MVHLARAAPARGAACPAPRSTGARSSPSSATASTYLLRLVTFVEGEPLIDARHLAAAGPVRARRASPGRSRVRSRTSSTPAADRAMQWDPRHVGAVVEALAPHVEDPRRRALVTGVGESAAAGDRAARSRTCRRQIVHCDVTDWNVIGRRDARRTADAVRRDRLRRRHAHAARLRARGRRLDRLRPRPRRADLRRGRDRARLRRGVPARGRRARGAPAPDRGARCDRRRRHRAAGGARAAQRLRPARAGGRLGDLRGGGAGAGRARRRRPSGWPAGGALRGRRRACPSGRLAASRASSAGAPRRPLADAALDPAARRPARSAPTARRASTPTRELSNAEPETIHLGLDVFAPEGSEVLAPLAGRVERAGERELVLAADGSRAAPRGARPRGRGGRRTSRPARSSGSSRAGGALPPHLHVQVGARRAWQCLPGLATPALARAWLTLCPHPGPLLGLAAPPSGRTARLLARRRAVIPQAQPLYYAAPPEMVRGAAPAPLRRARARLSRLRQQRRGRRPQPSARDRGRDPPAAPAQHELALPLREHDALRRAPRRAAARRRSSGSSSSRPDPRPTISRCASRAPRRARSDVLCVRDAYHGWTTATYEVSTSSVDNPLGAQSQPPEACIRCSRPTPTAAPTARTTPRPGARYADSVREAIAALAARGRAPAAFICEALYGNAGGIVLPDGYLEAAYAHVRAAGGVCIADEVQVGYGRLGAHFWGFEQQGVVPDIVTIAKATGNGHPVAAVITTERDRRSLQGQGGFFASVGGGPVSCEIGARRARRDRARRGCRRTPCASAGRCARACEELVGAARDRRRRTRHGPLPRTRPRARPRDEGAGARGGLRDLRAPARARRDRAADRRRRERAQAQAAARFRGSATPTGCSRRSTTCSRAAGRNAFGLTDCGRACTGLGRALRAVATGGGARARPSLASGA